jgi:membrane-associated phospholipid phosphatase
MPRRSIAAACLCTVLLVPPSLAAGQTPEAPLTASTATLLDRLEQVESRHDETREPAPDMPGFTDLFKPLKGDFKRFFSRNHLGIAQVGVMSAATFAPWDKRVRAATWEPGPVHDFLKPGAIVGGMLFQSGAAFTTWAIGRATDSPRVAQLGADLVRAQIVSQTVTQGLKLSTQRTRPDGTSLSFPSGHTASSFATASVLHSHFGWKAGVPAYAVAAWVAASRVEMKRHHVSDVIVGATVGLLAARSVTFGRNNARFALSPMAVPGGAGVSIVRINPR